jgi:DNA-binding SARP family transcriptional activator
VEFRVLGPLEVEDDAGQVRLGGARQRAVLALLLTRANEIVSTDRLIDQLWPGRPPKAAANTIQYYISQLRKALGADRIETRPSGYLIRVQAGELDLERFERLVTEGGSDSVRAALALWRGQPLADVLHEPFAQTEIHRLEELHAAALERRIEADLALGRRAEIVGELEVLVAEHPLRERLHELLMLALYRCGRQADALAVYAGVRRTLVAELGLEPGPALHELERAILRHDESLLGRRPVSQAPRLRTILVTLQHEDSLDAVLALAEPLARAPARELILAALVDAQDRLGVASSWLHERRSLLEAGGIAARAAAFTTSDPGADAVRLAMHQDVDLVIVDASPSVAAGGTFTTEVETLLAAAPSDVALVLGSRTPAPGPARPVLVPFGGGEHDWAAVEVAAWVARATDAPLTLLGTSGEGARRDASRLLANASLLVQRAIGIPAEPLLAQRGPEAVVAAAEGAGLVVIGLSPRWRAEGLGETRLAVARDTRASAVLVRAGLRPSGLAPAESLTRFSWTLGPPS